MLALFGANERGRYELVLAAALGPGNEVELWAEHELADKTQASASGSKGNQAPPATVAEDEKSFITLPDGSLVPVRPPVVRVPKAETEFVRGLLEYRLGNYSASSQWMLRLQEDLELDEDLREFVLPLSYLVLAMSQHHLGRPDEARQALSKGTELAQAKLPKLDSGDLGPNWQNWIIAHALLREAKALIEGSSRAGDGTK